MREEPEVRLEDLKPPTHRLEGKVVIVTGSTSGIGKATAILCAHEGAKVTVVGRRAEKGNAVVRTIEEDGGEALFVRADMTVEEDVQNVVRSTMEKWGRIDGLFNNAGTLIVKPTLELTRDDWDAFLNLDAYSYLRMIQLVVPIMEKQGDGSIVNCTSLAALDNKIDGGALYCFVKAGMNHMTHCIALEFADKGIRVNNILPGVIATEMVLSGPGAEDFDKMAALMPGGRPGTALECAYAVLYLLSDESSYTNGASLVIDNGLRGY